MKTNRILPTLLVGLATTLALSAAPKGSERVQVIYFEPERFTDVKDSWMGSDKARDDILDQLKTHIQERAGRVLGDGQKLVITFTDIDLAGDFEPGRSARTQDIRIVKDIYPPRMSFSFKLTDANGEVLKQGERNLRDMGFLMKISMNTSDPLRHEKALLDDWIRDEFRAAK